MSSNIITKSTSCPSCSDDSTNQVYYGVGSAVPFKGLNIGFCVEHGPFLSEHSQDDLISVSTEDLSELPDNINLSISAIIKSVVNDNSIFIAPAYNKKTNKLNYLLSVRDPEGVIIPLANMFKNSEETEEFDLIETKDL